MSAFRVKAVAAVAFGLVVMMGWLAKLHYDRATGLKIELPITGYDPRDLLSGYYFTFRVNYGGQDVCASSNGQRHLPHYGNAAVCHCVRAGESPVYWSGACDEKPADCDYFIKGRCQYNGFVGGIERFYISEAKSRERFTPSATAKVQLSVPKSGRALVIGLVP